MSEIFAQAYSGYGSALGHVFRPVVSINSYARLVYLAAMFPLGLAYFVSLVVAAAVGGSLIWTFVGPVILILAMFLSRWAGDLEAFLVHKIAKLDFRRPPTRLEPGLTWRQQLTTRLIDPSTWTGLLYLGIQFPVGVATFVIIVILGTVAGAFIAAPALLAFDEGFAIDFAPALDTPVEGLVLVLPGLMIFLFLIHFGLVASSAHAGWARLMLGSRAGTMRRTSQELPQPTPELPEPPDPGQAQPAIAVVASENEEPVTGESLTIREHDVLGLLALGHSNAEIAETLVLSEGTVKTHVKHVLAKLRVHNRTEAALYARDHNAVYSQAAPEAPLVRLRHRAP